MIIKGREEVRHFDRHMRDSTNFTRQAEDKLIDVRDFLADEDLSAAISLTLDAQAALRRANVVFTMNSVSRKTATQIGTRFLVQMVFIQDLKKELERLEPKVKEFLKAKTSSTRSTSSDATGGEADQSPRCGNG